MNKLLENSIIRLRATEPEDLEVLYRWENDTSLWQYGASVTPYSRFSLKQYLVNNKNDIYADKQLRMMVVLIKTDEVLGSVDLYDFDPFHRRAGVGILTDDKFRRKGYALQALNLLEKYAFEFLNMKQLYAIVPENNSGSRILFDKAGYELAGKLSDWLSVNDVFEDVLLFQKINASL